MRILVLCKRAPFPVTDGESLRIFNHARGLSAAHELDLVCTGSGGPPAELHALFGSVTVLPARRASAPATLLARLRAAFSVAAFAPPFEAVRAHLQELLRSRHYDVIWTSTDMVTSIPAAAGVPILTDVCDDGVLLLERELARTRGLLPRARVFKRIQVAKKFERRVFGPTDACLFVSEPDAERFRQLLPAARIEVVPNGVDEVHFAPAPGTPEPATLVFEGSMDFEPNADAAEYLCRELLPRIHARRPDVKVLLVGRDPTPAVRALASDSVTVTGWVDDVRPYVARASLFVCPLRSGAGIKNKILQAWSMGKAVLATSVSVGGLEVHDGENIVLRDDPDRFVDAVIELLADPARCQQIGERARQTVQRGYRWQARTAQFAAVLASIAAPRATRLAEGRPPVGRGGSGAPRVLMIALQFPPFSGSTGRLRTLSFVRHLPAAGWVPIVVTTRADATNERDDRTLEEIPAGARVVRARGGDLARMLSIRGLYPRWMATPDRFNSWAIGAWWAARRAAADCRADAVWMTFPVPSALLAGLLAHRSSRLPLVADLRDPIIYETWPDRPWERAVYRWLERRVVRAAAVVVVTTPSACEMYRRRYPEVPPDRFRVIPNGIDDAQVRPATIGTFPAYDAQAPLLLLHSGLIELPDRDPSALLRALALLRDAGALPARGLTVRLRASGREALYAGWVRELGLEQIVDLAPRLPHRDAVAEMQSATALLLLQGRPCNRQIPAKAYEYLASRRPIVALMDPQGDTHRLVADRWQVPYCADLADEHAIAATLKRLFDDAQAGRTGVPSESLIAANMRQVFAGELARTLDLAQRGAVAVPVGPPVRTSPAERGGP